MKLQTKARLFALGLAWFALYACTLSFAPAEPTADANAILTQAAQTLQAQLFQTQVAQAVTATAGALFPTATHTPTATFTATPIPPTSTLVPTATPIPIPCNWAQFVQDVSIPDGTIFASNADFVKTWRLKNIGTCTWTTDYDLVFSHGDAMDGDTTALSKSVAPGGTVDVSVSLEAPADAGSYRGYWELRSGNGAHFGIGAGANQPFYVDIKVLETNPDYAYDFALNMCAAEWRSGTENPLPCPGAVDDPDGFVRLLDNPSLEHRHENEPALWTHPDRNENGRIVGVYPPFKVESGDRFRATVGCLDESNGCYVRFRLEYQIGNDPVVTLGEWVEAYDGSATDIDIDLSALAGENVKFILRVTILGGSELRAHAFWFVPHIFRP